MSTRLREPAREHRRRGPTGPGRWSRLGLVLTVPLALSCEFIARQFSGGPESAHGEYAEGLAEAGLAATPRAQAWMEAAERALEEAEPVTLPARLDGWFAADSPSAVAVRFAPADRRWVTVRARIAGSDDTRLFIDAFRMPQDTARAPVILASTGDTTQTVSFRVRDSDEILVRVQPELLRGGAWELQITAADGEPEERETMSMSGMR